MVIVVIVATISFTWLAWVNSQCAWLFLLQNALKKVSFPKTVLCSLVKLLTKTSLWKTSSFSFRFFFRS